MSLKNIKAHAVFLNSKLKNLFKILNLFICKLYTNNFLHIDSYLKILKNMQLCFLILKIQIKCRKYNLIFTMKIDNKSYTLHIYHTNPK